MTDHLFVRDMDPVERSIFTCNSQIVMEKTLADLTGMVAKLTETVVALSKKLDDIVIKAEAAKVAVVDDGWFETKFVDPLVKEPVDRHSSTITITGVPNSSVYGNGIAIRILDQLKERKHYYTCWTTKSSSTCPIIGIIDDVNILEYVSLVNMMKYRKVPENSIIIVDLYDLLHMMTLNEIIAAIPHCNARNAILLFQCNNTINDDGKSVRICKQDSIDEQCRCDVQSDTAVEPCLDVNLEPLFNACLYRVQTTDDRFAVRLPPFKYDLHDGLGMRQCE